MDKDFSSELKINKTKINDELSAQASLFYFYAEEHAELEKTFNDLELEADIIAADMSSKLRLKYKNVKGGISETAIKSLLLMDEKYRDLRKKISKIESALKYSRIRIESLKMRADMLVSLSNNIRGEMKSSSFNKT